MGPSADTSCVTHASAQADKNKQQTWQTIHRAAGLTVRVLSAVSESCLRTDTHSTRRLIDLLRNQEEKKLTLYSSKAEAEVRSRHVLRCEREERVLEQRQT